MQENKITPPYNVYVSKSGNCVYYHAEMLGAPRLLTAGFLPGKGLAEKIGQWIAVNWTTQPALTKWMSEYASMWSNGGDSSHPTRSKEAKIALEAIFGYIWKNLDTVSATKSLFAERAELPAVTLAGTEPPKISKIFNDMTYQERRAILLANQRRVEEVPQEDLKDTLSFGQADDQDLKDKPV